MCSSSLVLYLNYGPFTSYAPSYDSTFANICKDDSDLIYTTYGEEPNLQGTFRYSTVFVYQISKMLHSNYY